ncbi:hypothetical protein SEVIR_5G146050v4 [Setaria viridis]
MPCGHGSGRSPGKPYRARPAGASRRALVARSRDMALSGGSLLFFLMQGHGEMIRQTFCNCRAGRFIPSHQNKACTLRAMAGLDIGIAPRHAASQHAGAPASPPAEYTGNVVDRCFGYGSTLDMRGARGDEKIAVRLPWTPQTTRGWPAGACRLVMQVSRRGWTPSRAVR